MPEEAPKLAREMSSADLGIEGTPVPAPTHEDMLAQTLGAEAPLETPETKAAAIAEVKERLAQSPEIAAPAINMHEAGDALDAYTEAQQETMRNSKEAKALFEKLNLPDGEKVRTPYSRQGVDKENVSPQKRLEDGLNGEVFNNREGRKRIWIPTMLLSGAGMAGGIGSVAAGLNGLLSTTAVPEFAQIGFGVGAGALALGALAWGGTKLVHSIKEWRHQATFKKLYGRSPRGLYMN